MLTARRAEGPSKTGLCYELATVGAHKAVSPPQGSQPTAPPANGHDGGSHGHTEQKPRAEAKGSARCGGDGHGAEGKTQCRCCGDRTTRHPQVAPECTNPGFQLFSGSGHKTCNLDHIGDWETGSNVGLQTGRSKSGQVRSTPMLRLKSETSLPAWLRLPDCGASFLGSPYR